MPISQRCCSCLKIIVSYIVIHFVNYFCQWRYLFAQNHKIIVYITNCSNTSGHILIYVSFGLISKESLPVIVRRSATDRISSTLKQTSSCSHHQSWLFLLYRYHISSPVIIVCTWDNSGSSILELLNLFLCVH